MLILATGYRELGWTGRQICEGFPDYGGLHTIPETRYEVPQFKTQECL